MLRTQVINQVIKPLYAKRWTWLVYLSGILLGLSGLDELPGILVYLLTAALLLFAVPHAACDLYIPAWLINPRWEKSPAYWASIAMLFLLPNLLIVTLWLNLSDVMMVFFLAIVAWHWGTADNYRLPLRSFRWLFLGIGRGCLIIGLPFFLQAEETAYWMLMILERNQSLVIGILINIAPYLVALGITLELLAPVFGYLFEKQRPSAEIKIHWIETLFLFALFETASPMLGFIIYFLILHSGRQLVRLTRHLPDKRQIIVEANTRLGTLLRLYKRSKLGLLISLSCSIAFIAWVISRGYTFEESLLLYLLYFSGFLLPHLVLGLIIDLRKKVLN